MSDTKGRTAIIAATVGGVLTCIGAIIAAVITGVFPIVMGRVNQEQMTPVAQVVITTTSPTRIPPTNVPPTLVPTPTQTVVPPTSTPTIRPTQPPTFVPTPTQTATRPTATSTLPPTQPPPTPTRLDSSDITSCFSGGECYDHFSKFETQLWCKAPQYTLSDSQLLIAAAKGTEEELKPCTKYNLPLKFIELRMAVTQSLGTSEINRAGIQSTLGDKYFTFALNTAGGAYIYDPIIDDVKTFPIDGSMAQHNLRVEWTGSKILFSVDNRNLYQIDSASKGDWFLLTVGAQEKSDITAKFDIVRWAYILP